MDDAPLDLSAALWSPRKECVRIFYKEMWDYANVSLLPRLFHPDFTFRGSLGPELTGYEEFIDYVAFVTSSLDQYTSVLGDIHGHIQRLKGEASDA